MEQDYLLSCNTQTGEDWDRSKMALYYQIFGRLDLDKACIISNIPGLIQNSPLLSMTFRL